MFILFAGALWKAKRCVSKEENIKGRRMLKPENTAKNQPISYYAPVWQAYVVELGDSVVNESY